MAGQEHESLYSDSVCSSPRSGGARGHDDEPRVRFMCSYGGRILPRPHDNQLRYVGGDTRIVAVNRNTTFSLLISKLSKLCGNNITVKYQLPNEDLDALISVTTDEDLENMMEEYDRLNSGDRSDPRRLRLFLFPAKLENASSLGSLLEGSKREHWFLDALNGVPVLTRRRSEVSSVASEVPDYLFGLDNIEDWDRDRDREERISSKPGQQGPGKSRLNSQHVAEVYSAPGSPVPISSPYGSISSPPPSIDSHMIAELAAKAERFGLRSDAPVVASGHRTQDPRVMVVDDNHQTTKLASKTDAEKSSNSSPEESRKEKIETPPEDVSPVPPPRSPPIKRSGSNSSIASMKREGSGSNLSAYGDEPKPVTNRPTHVDEIYVPAPGVNVNVMTQMPTDHYVEYTHPAQFLQPPPQPSAYWQMQEDSSGQVYYVAAGSPAPHAVLPRQPSAGAAPAMLQTRQPAYMPLQRMPSNVAYAPDVQGVAVLPVQKLAGSVPGSYPAKSPGKAPLYRGPAPRPMAPMMMRPPVASPDQYSYQHVGYEATGAAPQQVYYTQKQTVMNPQYQAMMAPVAVDMQSSAETNTEGSVFGRVSGSV